MGQAAPGRLLLLVPTQSYRADDFLAAARRLGVPVVVGTDRCHRIEDAVGPTEGLLSVDYRKPEEAAEEIAREAARSPIAGVVPADDATAVIAALAAERLGFPQNPPVAARRTANKLAQREALAAAGLPVPGFRDFPLDGGPEGPAASVRYPCVLKPLGLS